MSKLDEGSWGVWNNHTVDGYIHVMPVDEDGYVACGHVTDFSACFCSPEIKEGEIVVHRQPDWPGATIEEERRH